MSRTILQIRDLSKLYRLGEVGTGTLSQDLNRWWARLRGQEDPFALVGQVNRREQQSKSDFVWALKEINVDISQGEIVGIIGANGAGKSTLLKLISRITTPTTGRIRARGRIASLLEVGMGMHLDMTARENIYLNGAILGMRRHEITQKFDDIIDFAGCRLYVDTPIKRFSSGMRVRLGFAVAAFLEPEILILDEVLAVGDAEFQQKALAKIQEIQSGLGRTILYVSHNLSTIAELCSRAILLERGRVRLDGSASEAIAEYLKTPQRADTLFWQRPKGPVSRPAILQAKISERSDHLLRFGDPLVLEVTVISPHSQNVALEIMIKDQSQYPIIFLPSGLRFGREFQLEANTPRVLKCTIPSLPLAVGGYSLDLLLTQSGATVWDDQTAVLSFEMMNSDPCWTGHQFMQQNRQGCVHIPAVFEVDV